MNAEFVLPIAAGVVLFLLLLHFCLFARAPRWIKLLVVLATLAVYGYWVLPAVLGVEIANLF